VDYDVSALQALIEAVQEDQEQMAPAKRAALDRARRYRVELMTWVESQRADRWNARIAPAARRRGSLVAPFTFAREP
jgi:hypothetical protein